MSSEGNMLHIPSKTVSMADANSHYFKEISSLNKYVKDELKRDSRLNRNRAIDKKPSLNAVPEEINKSKSREP